MSPGSRSTISVSTCTDSWMPTARVMTLRYCEAGRLLLGDGAGLELRGDQGVVLGEPVALAVAHQVHAAVAHVADDALVAAEHQAHERGAHAALGRVGRGHAVDVRAGALDGRLHQRRGRGARLRRGWRRAEVLQHAAGWRDVLPDDLDGPRAGDLARRVTAHAVGDDVEARARVDQHRVFVVLALPADVGEAERFGGQGHWRASLVARTQGGVRG